MYFFTKMCHENIHVNSFRENRGGKKVTKMRKIDKMDYIIVNINKRMQRKKRERIYEYLKN